MIGGAGSNACRDVEQRIDCAVDKRPPELVSATVNGDRLVASFDELLYPYHAPDAGTFDVRDNGLFMPVNGVKVEGASLVLQLARPVASDDVVSFGWEHADIETCRGTWRRTARPRRSRTTQQ